MSKLKEILIALSLANLCMVEQWSKILYNNPYFMKYDPSKGLIALLFCVLFLGAVFYLFACAEQRIHYKPIVVLARCTMLVPLLYAFNYVRKNYAVGVSNIFSFFSEKIGHQPTVIMLAVAAVILTFFIVKYSRQLSYTVKLAAFILSPFLVVTFTGAIWTVITSDAGQYDDKPLAVVSKVPKKSDIRVVWIIFDELDQETAFDRRSKGLQLPEFDRLRSKSFTATHALPPSSNTSISIPALLSGNLLKSVDFKGYNKLLLHYKNGGEAVFLGAAPSVFSEAQSQGFNTASVGWGHPLCRIFNSNLNACEWLPVEYISGEPDVDLFHEISNQYRDALNFNGFTSIVTNSIAMEHHVDLLTKLVETSKKFIVNKDLGFMMLHLPTPHKPFCYDAKNNSFVTSNITVNGYSNNLVLADKILGEFRVLLKNAKLTDSTVMIVSSDHWLRGKPKMEGVMDYRVPFIVNMPGNESGFTYEEKFNTVLTRQLVGELLAGNIKDYSSLAQWISGHRDTSGPAAGAGP